MRHVINMEVECNTKDVLLKIKTNRTEHAKIVAEARVGFVEQAKIALKEKLSKLSDGEIVSLHINLVPPQDYTSEYDTIIQMLSMHQNDSITLGADEVRMFIEDKWDWTDAFMATNANYSVTAAARRR